ncbi:MAG: GGDEF domain-containing protein [Eubacteriales bacterium]
MFNLRGKYRVSTWLTAPCIILGPWLSILLDPSVLNGDFVPLIYVAMSIQLCSILLREKHTIVISIIQFAAMIALIMVTPALKAINWPSLLTFIVFTSVVGVLYGYTNKHQLTQIEQQRNQLLEDEARLRELSVRDPLTGLYNRQLWKRHLTARFSAQSVKAYALSVIMADIDRFKSINDTIGRSNLGDKALK